MTFLQLTNQKEKYEKNRGFPPHFLIYKKFINLATLDLEDLATLDLETLATEVKKQHIHHELTLELLNIFFNHRKR